MLVDGIKVEPVIAYRYDTEPLNSCSVRMFMRPVGEGGKSFVDTTQRAPGGRLAYANRFLVRRVSYCILRDARPVQLGDPFYNEAFARITINHKTTHECLVGLCPHSWAVFPAEFKRSKDFTRLLKRVAPFLNPPFEQREYEFLDLSVEVRNPDPSGRTKLFALLEGIEFFPVV